MIGKNESKVMEVNREQFSRCFMTEDKEQQFEDIFNSIDTNEGQDISKHEIKHIVRQLGLKFTERDINMMIEVVSKDGDKVNK